MREHRYDWNADPEGVDLGRALGDGAAMSVLRRRVAALDEGVNWSRRSDHEVIARLHRTIPIRPEPWPGLVAWGSCSPATSSPVAPPASAPAPAPARAAPRAPPPRETPPPTAPETTFAPDLDVEAMVAALRNASAAGVPFCEECARAAAREALAA